MKANLIRAKMKEKGFTQEEVAEKVGISSNSLSRKILGKRDFRLTEIKALCEVLEIENVYEIFFS